jgi:thiol-disulfide isomerase/thioredoxin
MEVSIDLNQKFNIMGFKFSLFTIIVFIILTYLIFTSCFESFTFGKLIKSDPFESIENEHFTNEETIHAYNFNTEWCGYSIKFQPIWKEFMDKTKNLNIVVHDIKCDQEKNQEICKKYSETYLPGEKEPVLTGYPTILFTKPGSEYPIVYEQDRNAEALVEFTNKLLS